MDVEEESSPKSNHNKLGSPEESKLVITSMVQAKGKAYHFNVKENGKNVYLSRE